ncbi:hypothetical protein R3P38DRAFT_2644843, partial [Favolaschia claudopus]
MAVQKTRRWGPFCLRIFCALFLVFLMVGINEYKCRGCELGIKTEGALHRHQNACSAYLQYLGSIAPISRPITSEQPRRKTKHHVPGPTKKNTTLAQRKNRNSDGSETPSASTSAAVTAVDFSDPKPAGEPDPAPDQTMPDTSPPPSPQIQPAPEWASGRSKRNNMRAPARYRDILPEPVAAVQADTEPPTPPARSVRLLVRDRFETTINSFGLFRSYLHRPTYDPDSLITTDDLSNQFTPVNPSPVPSTSNSSEPAAAAPTSSHNTSVSLLLAWENNGHTTKTRGQTKALLNTVLRDPHFKLEELDEFERAEKQAEKTAAEAMPFLQDFEKTSVDIEVPSGSKDVPSRTFPIPGLYYRSLVSIIKAAFTDPLSRHFHFSPFELWHKVRSSAAEVRVFSEIYNSRAFIDEHDNVRLRGKLPPDAQNCKLEKIVAALMFWSDSTHLANFGTAKLWPIYMLFGNLSKYLRKPNSGAEHHVAYIPSLPDALQDELAKFHAKWATQKSDILTHCRRELMHAVWKHLLDDEFLHAYTYGIVIRCWDGIERRVYPRFFTYSADYPEKVLLATIRDGGLCPCPRCLTPKNELHLMGYARDLAARTGSKARKYLGIAIQIARKAIYKSGVPIGSERINALLKETSSVPTINAFIDRLGDDFNLHRMLVIDFMHEFELGVWKNLFTHLIRLLYAQPNGQALVDELNRRYRNMPRFGVDTIRRFATNASEMKKLGARDFEDLLQCAIPAFAGLFSGEDDERVLKLLFRMAEWHAFAKLRMHTDPTLEHLRRLTPEIGRLMREFKNTTCANYETFELPREVAARGRREQRAATARTADDAVTAPQSTPAAATTTTKSSKKVKTLNLNIYKWHAAGDVHPTIPVFSTTDVYSTQHGESLHRLVKRLYALTNKREHEAQIADKVMRLHRARAAARFADEKLGSKLKTPQNKSKGQMSRARIPQPDAADPFGFDPAVMDVHHAISNVRRSPLDLFRDFSPRKGDPAMADFLPKLQDHLLGRLLGRDFDGDSHDDFSAEDRNTVRIVNNRIYQTQIFRVNYTTYDVRRDQDVLKVGSFVMMRSPEAAPNAHPYWYAQILGVFNATVFRVPSSGDPTPPEQMFFLWVRWLGVEPDYRAGIKRARLPKVGFVPEDDPYAFGFLDPSHVIRGSHCIQDFARGLTNDLLATDQPTAARPSDWTQDWASYYVDIFADRDMLMRYAGGGADNEMEGGAADSADDDDDDSDSESSE